MLLLLLSLSLVGFFLGISSPVSIQFESLYSAMLLSFSNGAFASASFQYIFFLLCSSYMYVYSGECHLVLSSQCANLLYWFRILFTTIYTWVVIHVTLASNMEYIYAHRDNNIYIHISDAKCNKFELAFFASAHSSVVVVERTYGRTEENTHTHTANYFILSYSIHLTLLSLSPFYFSVSTLFDRYFSFIVTHSILCAVSFAHRNYFISAS